MFLSHLERQGTSRASLQILSNELLHVIRLLRLDTMREVSLGEIRHAAERFVIEGKSNPRVRSLGLRPFTGHRGRRVNAFTGGQGFFEEAVGADGARLATAGYRWRDLGALAESVVQNVRRSQGRGGRRSNCGQ